MSLKRPFECPHRWLVISGNPSRGYAHYGPFESEAEAADFRDDWIAQGAEWAEVVELHQPWEDDSPHSGTTSVVVA